MSLWLIGTTGLVSQSAPTPILILLYGGFGISVGLVVLGRKVIKTIGEDLAKVTPSRFEPFLNSRQYIMQYVIICNAICNNV